MSGSFIQADLLAMLNTAEFADSAVLAGQPVSLLFNRAYSDDLGVSKSVPTVILKTSDVPSPIAGASLVIQSGQGAGSYTVTEHEPDGTGLSTLLLRKA